MELGLISPPISEHSGGQTGGKTRNQQHREELQQLFMDFLWAQNKIHGLQID